MATEMTMEERLAAMEKRMAELEEELAVARAKIALNTDGIISNKQMIHDNRKKIADNGEHIEKQHKGLMDLMADHMAATYASQMEGFVDPSVGITGDAPKAAAADTPSAAEKQENAYTAEPEMAPEEAIEAASYVASPAEIVEDMKAAGIEVPEAPEKAEAPKAAAETPSAAEKQENAYTAEPEMAPEEAIEAASYVASPAEIVEDMKAAGIEVPEKTEAPKAADDTPSAAEQQGNVYAEQPELSAIERLEMATFTNTPAAIEKEIKEVEEENK